MPDAAETVANLLTGAEGGLFHLDDLSEEVYIAFGGAKGLALKLHQEFTNLPAGSPGRERILDGVMKLAMHRNKTGQDETSDDIAAMDEKLIEQRAMELLKRGAQTE